MRIACSSTREGNIYRDGHPDLLLRVGPIGGDAEATLLRLIKEHLTEPCTPTAH